MTENPNAFVDGVMNGFLLHIEPPRICIDFQIIVVYDINVVFFR